ncbi:sigma-70 family RNA polymerase sigma factor [Rhabdobacter roseus]|uniref:RNA polymerase sigma-70 factor (ECF subfamily) n=1 Tax=Rhabdobacter roseus TaxID=1655419 RepID=A0A840TGA1_9BACT|nr:RNA polymerase sigma factor [Rhabdobacter roseus]MBB5282241.1 RNA polymerase sigma-70 factor (ECF subfamily) [Rhabdobacter roseus]
MPEDNSAVLLELLDGCLRANRRSQEMLYKQFYGYAMGVCMRYTRNREAAREILNDGFLKVLTRLESYDRERSFKVWLGRIMINTALDHYRREARHQVHEDIQAAETAHVNEVAISQLSHAELMEMVQALPPAYRITFNLAVIDGYSHEEIAEQLGISVGASKSNLSRAREKLKVLLAKKTRDEYERVSR